jgi:hypothetical protein
MLTKIILLLLVFHIPQKPTAVVRPQQAIDLKAKLRMPVHDYRLSAGNFVEALMQVASEFQIPMGIEWVNMPSAGPKISLTLKDATVKEVLHTIVSNQTGVKMTIDKNIVHVCMPDLIPDRENPLKVSIKAFEVYAVPAEAASQQLHETLKRTLHPPKPQQGPAGGGVITSGASNIDYPTISVTLKNATVEDVLDSIASASARKIWIVTFSDDATLTASGYRRTMGLWTKATVSDDEQPVWDLFHWGESLPSAVLDSR